MAEYIRSERALAECIICGTNTLTYKGLCNKCAVMQMEHNESQTVFWRKTAESLAAIIRGVTRNVDFIEYERDREQRINNG